MGNFIRESGLRWYDPTYFEPHSQKGGAQQQQQCRGDGGCSSSSTDQHPVKKRTMQEVRGGELQLFQKAVTKSSSNLRREAVPAGVDRKATPPGPFPFVFNPPRTIPFRKSHCLHMQGRVPVFFGGITPITQPFWEQFKFNRYLIRGRATPLLLPPSLCKYIDTCITNNHRRLSLSFITSIHSSQYFKSVGSPEWCWSQRLQRSSSPVLAAELELGSQHGFKPLDAFMLGLTSSLGLWYCD